MIERVRPAVVRIDTDTGSGSGVIVEIAGATGYVVTNQHVVDGAGHITVTVGDGKTYTGHRLGSDSVRDLAVVRICCDSFTDVPFEDTWDLKTGTEVVAIGYALGILGEASVTRGIVSAVRYDASYASWVIQTDAPINPGNSGGPMFSTDGTVLGVNTFKATEVGVEGLGFAIAAHTVQEALPRLIAATPIPTTTPTRHPTSTPAPKGVSFGPYDGNLPSNTSDMLITVFPTFDSLSDGWFEASFRSPWISTTWSYGFIFRDNGSSKFVLAVEVVDSSYWYWQLAVLPGWIKVQDDYRFEPGPLDTRPGESNHLRVIANGAVGSLYVNDEKIADVDLSALRHAGTVAVISEAFNTDDAPDGQSTAYSGFRGCSFGAC